MCLQHAPVQDDAQQVVGATVEDQQTGRKTDVHARIVINATGPFADQVRGPKHTPFGLQLCVLAALVHSAAHLCVPQRPHTAIGRRRLPSRPPMITLLISSDLPANLAVHLLYPLSLPPHVRTDHVYPQIRAM